MVTYSLSNNQRKALFVRATSIFVALPIEPKSVDDCFPDLVGHDINISSWQDELLVEPRLNLQEGGLGGILGVILDDSEARDRFCLSVNVLVCQIIPIPCRHKMERIQWPQTIVLPNGKVFPWLK